MLRTIQSLARNKTDLIFAETKNKGVDINFDRKAAVMAFDAVLALNRRVHESEILENFWKHEIKLRQN